MNFAVFYSLIGAELGLVVAIGTVAARRALYRQEIKHSAMMLEHVEPMLKIANATPAGGVLTDAVGAGAKYLEPPAEIETIDSAAAATWVQEARLAAVGIADVKGEVTADDVIEACPVSTNVHTRYVASVFVDQNEWQKIGERSSKRSHRKIAVWARKMKVAA